MTTYGWSQEGGGTQFPRSLALSLQRNHIEVIVLAAEGKHIQESTPYFVEEAIENGVKLYKIFNRPTTFLDAENPRREIMDENIYRIFDNIIETEKPDIVHYHNFLGLSFSISELPKKYRIPSLFTAHNFHFLDPNLYMFDFYENVSKWNSIDLLENSHLIKNYPHLKTDYKIRQEVAKKTLRDNIDVFVAVSQKFAQIYDEFSGINHKTVVINQISEICNTHVPRTKEFIGKLRVGYLESVYPHKGVHLIYQAADILSDYDIEFLLYGNAVIEYLNNLRVKFPNAKVRYMGSYQPKDLAEISKDLDCTIISSILDEAGLLVAPEALSLGLPIIGANIGGITDFVIDGLNGKLYKHNDPNELATAVKYLFQNPSELKRMQLNSYLPFNFDDYTENLINLYKHLVDKKTNYQLKNFQLLFTSKLVNRASELMNNKMTDNPIDIDDLLKLIDKDLSKEIKRKETNKKNYIQNLFQPLMLNLASQGEVVPGFINIDKNPQKDGEITGDIRDLEFDDDTVEIIVARNILQVFSHREVQKILLEWKRVLKPGGTIILSVPDLKSILEAYSVGNLDFDETQKAIFGYQQNNFDYFYNAFDENLLEKFLVGNGFSIFEMKKLHLSSTKYLDIYVRCIKNK